MSDADALWLSDPMADFNLPGVRESSIVASRGQFPDMMQLKWGGTTMCMGFILFRATPPDAMKQLLDEMNSLVQVNEDDQISVNEAVDNLGVVWRDGSDMRFEESTDLAFGTIPNLTDSRLESIAITLLPHSKYTRVCGESLSNVTVAHCGGMGRAPSVKIERMKMLGFWDSNFTTHDEVSELTSSGN